MAEPAAEASEFLPEGFEPGKGAGAVAASAPSGGSDSIAAMLGMDKSATDDLIGLQRQKVSAETKIMDDTTRREEGDRAYMAKMLAREGVAMDDVKPWDAKTERQKYRSDPIQDFGSFASVFAIAASAFTKTPMTNALNASAAAMNAVRERKDEEYKYAYTAWKDNTELAIKRGNMMHQQYGDAMALLHTDMSLGETKMKQLAAKFGDQQTLVMMEHGLVPQLFEMMASRAKAVEGMTKAMSETDAYTMRKKAFDQWQEQNPTSSPMEKMNEFNSLMGIKETAEQQWNRQYWASHQPSGDKETDYKNWLAEYKKFKEADSPFRLSSSGALASELERRTQQYTKDLVDQGVDPQEAHRQGFDRANAEVTASKSGMPQAQLDQIGWNKASIDNAAKTYNKTGIMPKNLGTRTVAAAITGAVQNRATELLEEQGITPEERAKNWQKFSAEKVAIQRFESGPQGNTIRSLGVVVDHLGTLRQLALALHNGNIPLFNEIAQSWAQQTGSPVPTNFDTAKQIVGTEIIKSLGVAGAGTQSERAEAANSFARKGSPRQIMEGIDKVMRPLMLGQLKGLERQFVTSTGLGEEEFLRLLGPEAESFMRPKSDKVVPTQADIDWAKKSPERRKQFVDKFGREP